MNEVGTVEQNAHLRHRPLALLNLVFRRTLLGALVVVGFDLLDEFAVGKHMRGATFVHDGLGDAIFHGLNHGVFIDHAAEHIQRGIDGGAGKTNVSGIGQRVAQIFGKTIRAFNAFVGDLHLLFQTGL